jgi:methylenetetrahydrofolate dehydrogenase (NADP+)/methenyltetrahydrofolate cyclohydrolase
MRMEAERFRLCSAIDCPRRSERRRVTAVIRLDGVRLAAQRLPALRARAAAVRDARGSAPVLGILAFADASGSASYVAGKVRAGIAAGVDVEVRTVPYGAGIEDARRVLDDLAQLAGVDGVFVQFPYPDAAWGAEVESRIPDALDVDVMSPARVTRFLNDAEQWPPVTVSAAFALLDAHGVVIAGRRGVVIAEPSDFAAMFRHAFVRRGVTMPQLIPPASAMEDDRLRVAEVVIVAAGVPGLVDAQSLAPGAIVIDVGYFNPGGRGDIDIGGGITHLGAIAAVPGSIGPMTVSCLIERVIRFAESRA